MTTMRDLDIRPNRFTIIKERLARGYRNAEYQQPYYQVGDLTRYLTAEKTWINEQFAAELEHIETEDVASFFPQILRHAHIEVLAHGNIYKEDALKMTNVIESIIRCRPLPQSQWRVRRNILLPAGSNFVYEKTLKDPENVNNCIEYYLFLGAITDTVLRSNLLLFAQMTEEPAFDQLRSKEQLGYVVWSGARYTSTTIGYRVIIQSERTAEYLETRIDAFLQSFGRTLETMSSEEFEGHRRSIINKRLEKLKNLGSETSRYWSHIGSEYFDFLQHESDATALRALTKTDLLEFYRKYIDPTSPLRAKLSVHMKAQNVEADSAVKIPEDQKSQLSAALERCFDDEGVAVDPDRLALALDQLDLGTGNVEEITAALNDILMVDLQLPAHQVQPFLAQSKEVLESFGVHSSEATEEPEKYTSTTTNGTADGSLLKRPRPVVIENVPMFKARHPMSSAPSPLSDLSEFEEFDSKL
jgi:insulysin